MASPVLSRRERGQEASGDVWPDRELREANQHMHEFLDLLGHELRSPLAAIRNTLRVLELRGDDAATREWVRSLMDRQMQCIGRLVDDLLEVSRIAHTAYR
jgi:signal transduction histidine kinase